MKRLKKVAKLITDGLLYFLARVIPNKEGLVVFSMSGGRYSDNSKALFEHINRFYSQEIDALWLSDPKLEKQNIPRDFKEKFLPRNSIKGIATLLKAEVCILSHGFGDYGFFKGAAKGKRTLMLWHAITTKCCGLLDEKLNKQEKELYWSKETRHYDAIICSSDVDRYYTCGYTGVPIQSVYVTGLPRNDFIHNGTRSVSTPTKTIVLYAPTFRDYGRGGSSIFFPFDIDDYNISKWAEKSGLTFILRPHPNDVDSVSHAQQLSENYPEQFIDGSYAVSPDVRQLILDCDAIVTDYSSIYVDGLLIDRPPIFVDFDREIYLKTRGLAYDYELITPGPKVHDWADFAAACKSIKDGALSYKERRAHVRKMFFNYQDSESSERVVSVIRKLMNA